MVYRGRVSKGLIVLEGAPSLPEGASVTVELTMSESLEGDDRMLAAELLKLAGSCSGLPSDYSVQHDHYLYGVPKQ